MSNIDKHAVQAVADLKAGYTLGHADVAILNELARISLASLEAEPVEWRVAFRLDGQSGSDFEKTFEDQAKMNEIISLHERAGFSTSITPLFTAPPAPVSVPDDVSGPLAHAYKELTPTFMRNHIDVFERYGIYPDGSAGIQAMRIALDSMNRRAAMLQGAEPVTTAYKLRDAMEVIRNSGIAIDAEKIFAERDALDSTVIADGWVLVPIEPTYQMCEAMGLRWESPRFPDRYKAMIAAAPHFREIVNSSTNNFLENTETSTNCPCCGRKPLKNKTCSVAGCDGKHVARGFCVKHYAIERKKDPSRRESIRAADKRYRARKAAVPQQEVTK